MGATRNKTKRKNKKRIKNPLFLSRHRLCPPPLAEMSAKNGSFNQWIQFYVFNRYSCTLTLHWYIFKVIIKGILRDRNKKDLRSSLKSKVTIWFIYFIYSFHIFSYMYVFEVCSVLFLVLFLKFRLNILRIPQVFC